MIDILEYMKAQKVVHRDIKPDNILIDSNYNIVLTDFGYSIKVENA